MFNIGSGELILAAIAALLLIPPKNLPRVATTLGRWLGELSRAVGDVKQAMNDSLKNQDKKNDKQ